MVRFIYLFEDLKFNQILDYPPGSNLPTWNLLGHQKHGIIQKIGEVIVPSLSHSLTTVLYFKLFLLTPNEETPCLLLVNILPSCPMLHLPKFH